MGRSSQRRQGGTQIGGDGMIGAVLVTALIAFLIGVLVGQYIYQDVTLEEDE